MDYESTVDLDSLDLGGDTFCEQQCPYGCQTMFLKTLIMANNKGLRFPETVIEADNMYQILLILLQGAL